MGILEYAATTLGVVDSGNLVVQYLTKGGLRVVAILHHIAALYGAMGNMNPAIHRHTLGCCG